MSKKKILISISLMIFFAFTAVIMSYGQSSCNNCQYREKTAACFSIHLGGSSSGGGTGKISVSFEAGGQVKCKSGTSTCSPQLCSN